MDAVFISRLAPIAGATTDALRVAVKDLVDLTGTITTAGCRAVERRAAPAARDAPLLAGIRAAEARGAATIVGKANLHELAFGADGVNPAYGTPVNPLDARCAPGGSSSGSAVAVASGLADVAIGSDTGGSIRIPAACCGVVGLKTTHGRIPLEGTWPLAPSLDTFGPLAASVTGVVAGMELLEPGFASRVTATPEPRVIGRLRVPGTPLDPAVDAAVDLALRATGLEIVDVTLQSWSLAADAALVLLLAEAWQALQHLVDDPDVTPPVAARIRQGATVDEAALSAAWHVRGLLRKELSELLGRVEAIALPTLSCLPPTLQQAPAAPLTAWTRVGNLAGVPSLSLPVPVPSALRSRDTAHLPASIQLLGGDADEERLVRLGAIVEAAVA